MQLAPKIVMLIGLIQTRNVAFLPGSTAAQGSIAFMSNSTPLRQLKIRMSFGFLLHPYVWLIVTMCGQ